MQCLFGRAFKSHNKVLHQSHSFSLSDSGIQDSDKNKRALSYFVAWILWFLQANKELECSEYTYKQSKLCLVFSNACWVVLGIEPMIKNGKLWSGHVWPVQIISWYLQFCQEHHLMALLSEDVGAFFHSVHSPSTLVK